jgi:polyhydroxyalkanoate synthesis repressor PhaR
MTSSQSGDSGIQEDQILIRKYPNRRYYNTRESRHVTLQEICELVRDGHDIRVTDSRTDEDITGAVLTQILLELESPKLAFFPTSLLQHLIRINTGILDNFTESYFQQAFAAFGTNPSQWASGFSSEFKPPAVPGAEAWTDFLNPFFPKPSPSAASDSSGPESSGSDDSVPGLRSEIEALKQKLEILEKREKR